jgi:hypothetical protein
VEAKRVLNLLESEPPEVWLELGNLQFIKNKPISNSDKFMVFILEADYSLLKDESYRGKVIYSGIF